MKNSRYAVCSISLIPNMTENEANVYPVPLNRAMCISLAAAHHVPLNRAMLAWLLPIMCY